MEIKKVKELAYNSRIGKVQRFKMVLLSAKTVRYNRIDITIGKGHSIEFKGFGFSKNIEMHQN